MGLRFTTTIRRLSPPWLQRSVGGRLMAALAEPFDRLNARAGDGVRLRFPHAELPSALPSIGRDRRIRRGPSETANTYARRLRMWLDAHRNRGGHVALLTQQYAFFQDWLRARMDVVYQNGARRWIDVDGNITRDSIVWEGHGQGPEEWAHAWLVLHLPGLIPMGTSYLVTGDGERIVTSDGEYIVVTRTISPGDLTPEEAAIFLAIPREWSAAHLPYITVVLLWGTRRLWNYPQPVPTWSEWGASGALWGDSPVTLRTE